MSIVMPSSNNRNSVNGSSLNGDSPNGKLAFQAHSASKESATSVEVVPNHVKHSWLMGKLPMLSKASNSNIHFEPSDAAPKDGDCVLAKTTKVGNHTRLFTDENQYSRVYVNDLIAGVVGSRYATDAYHATEIDRDNLHMLTNGGLMGTVCDRHRSMKKPTELEMLGFLVDSEGVRINMKDRLFRPAFQFPSGINPVFTVGTGMNSGKTTSTARLAHALNIAGHRVAVVKLTGSASHRDIHEFNATGAVFSADFSEYGFPSTYLASQKELEGLYCRMMNDAAAHSPDVVLIEIADGVYQRETESLLNSELLQSTAAGVVLTAACAASAVGIEQAVRHSGWDPVAVTGLITNAPLFVKEFSARSETPVCDTGKNIDEICGLIMSRVCSMNSSAK